jgi:hypothetical protein
MLRIRLWQSPLPRATAARRSASNADSTDALKRSPTISVVARLRPLPKHQQLPRVAILKHFSRRRSLSVERQPSRCSLNPSAPKRGFCWAMS